MKAVVLEENNKLIYKDVPNPSLNSGEVLLEIKACGICSSDFSRVYSNGAYFYPIILGHEFSGKIIECANDVDRNLVGKKAVVYPLLPCNECEFCKEKSYAQCKNYSYFGSRQNGAMAEYIAVPIWNLKIIPDDLSCLVASVCEPTAVAIHAIKKINAIQNKKICIIGTGIIGIICGLYAKALGANVTLMVRNNEKKTFLKELKFDNFISEDSENSYDYVIECVGSNSSINTSLKIIKPHGQIVLVGNPAENVVELLKNNYWKILRSEVNLQGVWNSSFKNTPIDDWDVALDFLSKQQNIVQKLITHKYKLEDELRAFNIKSDEKLRIKGVFVNDK